MTIRYIEKTPSELYFEPDADDVAARMTPEHVDRVAQIFNTPLTGSYAWDYIAADEKISRLYRLGKELNWNAQTDIDWDREHPKNRHPAGKEGNPLAGYPPFEALDREGRLEYSWHSHAWAMSQFLHGEQGALLVASQLVSCAPTYEAKLYAASQTFDEARHVEVFTKYLREKVGIVYPINVHLKALLDKILTDPRWDLKFIGMQIIIEGLALAAFNTTRLFTKIDVLRDIVNLVIRDEARHVAFGVTYMEQFVKALPEDEVEARAKFAYEACVVMRERLVASDVHQRMGWDVDETRRFVLKGSVMGTFRNLLFTRIIPNLKKIGLLTESVRPLYDELGILEYEDLEHDGAIDWAELGSRT